MVSDNVAQIAGQPGLVLPFNEMHPRHCIRSRNVASRTARVQTLAPITSRPKTAVDADVTGQPEVKGNVGDVCSPEAAWRWVRFIGVTP